MILVSEGLNTECEYSVQCYAKVENSGCQYNKCVCLEHMHDFNGSCYKNISK